jgi:hypothetical protein
MKLEVSIGIGYENSPYGLMIVISCSSSKENHVQIKQKYSVLQPINMPD